MNQPKQRTGQAIANRTKSDIAVGTYSKLADVNAVLKRAAEEMHLISPATSVGRLPEGCGVAITMVHVDERDIYDIPGSGSAKGLGKTVLQKLGAALGISWDPFASGRIDDGSDPYYCHWRAVGAYRAFDGQIQLVQGSKEMDLREGSAQVQSLRQRYKDAQRDPAKRAKAKDPSSQIREMRLHLLAHAETKAQLRAIRSLGIRTSYTAEELRKPFVAARVMFTGETSDPVLARMFAEKTADSFLGARASLFGTAAAPAAIPSGSVSPRLAAPPSVSSSGLEEDDWVDAPADEHHEPAQRPGAQEGTREGAPANTNAEASGFVIPGGNAKGTPLADATDRDLEYWGNRIAASLDEGTSRDAARDQALCDAIFRELDRRKGAL